MVSLPSPLIASAIITAGALLCTSKAADLYVSTAGNNANPGTLSSPFRSITFASNAASPGDTVYVRGGVYFGTLNLTNSGTSAAPITIRNFNDETPVIDASGVGPGSQGAVVTINGTDHVTLQGFELRNLTTDEDDDTPIGILIRGNADGITIDSCHIHSIRNDGDDGNAHGILVSGNSSSIQALTISNNLIENLILGNSEALVLNGNVDGFVVSGNTVRNCNNIGIDFIGFEGTNSNSTLDQARNGLCVGNTVHGSSTVSNPAYNSWSCAGIYVDGGRDIVIEGNRLYQNDIGIEIASEHAGRATSGIDVRNNLVWNNTYGGIFTGGYSPSVGSTEDCTITGNTTFNNDTARDGNGELLIRYRTFGLDVYGNIFYAGIQRLVVSRITTNTSNLRLDYNVYMSPSSPFWSWGNTNWFSGFSSWKSATGQDANTKFANPGFMSTTGSVGSYDLSISDTSPAHGAGLPTYMAMIGELDAFGNPRLNGVMDAGAFEVPSSLTPIEQWRLANFGTAASSGDAADSADPDGDGSINLAEYAFSGDPNASDGGARIRLLSQTQFELPINPNATEELNYSIYSNPSLASGSTWQLIGSRFAGDSWSTMNGVTISENNGFITISDTRTNPHCLFYRASVTR